MKCSVLESIHVIGKKWAVPILLELNKERFSGFYKFVLKTGITPRILSKQLRELTELGLIRKTDNNNYYITQKGKELCKIIDEIKKWNIKWNNVHEACLHKSCIDCGYFLKQSKF